MGAEDASCGPDILSLGFCMYLPRMFDFWPGVRDFRPRVRGFRPGCDFLGCFGPRARGFAPRARGLGSRVKGLGLACEVLGLVLGLVYEAFDLG